MKRIRQIQTLIFCMFAISGICQIYNTQYLDNNRVRALYNNDNILFMNQQTGHTVYEIPKGSGKNSIYSHSLWIGGTDDYGQLRISAHKYLNGHADFYPGTIYLSGPNAGTCDSALSVQYNKIWRIDNYIIEDFKYHYENNLMSGYTIPQQILEWPAHGVNNCDFYLAPFFDRNGDAIYNPINGDYPLIKGDQMLFWVFNDKGITHNETNGTPMGVEVRCSAYSFSCDSLIEQSNEVLNFTTFLNYKIINRTSETFGNTYIGLLTDGDIGYSKDDYVGFDLGRNAYYFYNGEEEDSTGDNSTYGTNPPAQAIVLLKGVRMDNNGIDQGSSYPNNCDESINGFNFYDDIIDNELWGFTNFCYYNSDITVLGEPTLPEQYYHFMQGYWKNGMHFTYGGNGFNGSTYTKFMFPGNSDPLGYSTACVSQPNWTEVTANNAVGDRRGLGSIGPFTFEPGEVIDIDIAFVWSIDSLGGNVINKLLTDVDIIRQMYRNDALKPCQKCPASQNNEKICMVTVDTALWKNKIIIHKTPGQPIKHYVVSKETATNIYTRIGVVPYNGNNFYIDTLSNPESHCDRYKISFVDSCNIETDKSPFHKTMNLVLSSFGSTVGLVWDEYIDESGDFIPPRYYILRGTSPDNMEIKDSVTGSQHTYNDPDVFADYYYMIGVRIPDDCNGTKNTSMAFSNRKTNVVNSIENKTLTLNSVRVYPNPSTNVVNIKFNNPTNIPIDLILTNCAGRVVFSKENISGTQTEINNDGIPPGVYFLKMKSEFSIHIEKIIFL